ncbi:hypothetical protein DFH08DRAFT_887542 [Mycena albidolilacea]|uniref:Uncharacterized protein n=1 Tax=Mycena albidolilacea TaxID=1033008 RepID=A0AAD6ZIF7_9AGAR|nr:hypothetical protein DFH08DRAFT_887542 [Mycena albidolilacea]
MFSSLLSSLSWLSLSMVSFSLWSLLCFLSSSRFWLGSAFVLLLGAFAFFDLLHNPQVARRAYRCPAIFRQGRIVVFAS